MTHTFREFSELLEDDRKHIETLKLVPKGSKVSFTHHKLGKVSGTFRKFTRLGGFPKVVVDHPTHGTFYIPPRDIDQAQPKPEKPKKK